MPHRAASWGPRPVKVVGPEALLSGVEIPPTWADLSPETRLCRALLDVERRVLESPEALVFSVLEALGELVEAPLGTCVVAPRIADLPPDDPLGGYRLLRVYHSSPDGSREQRAIEAWTDAPAMMLDEPCNRATAAAAGRDRVVFVREQVDTPVEDLPLMASLGTIDRLTATVSFHPFVEVHFVHSRRAPAGLFTAVERRRMQRALDLLAPFSARLAAFHGFLEGQEPLQPNERVVFTHLLGPLSEKEIAAEMGMTKGALHQYVVRVYRRWRVRSRCELFHRWVTLASPSG